MSHYLYIALGLCLLCFGHWLVKSVRANRYHKKRAAELGAQEPHRYVNKYPFGMDFFLEILKAEKQERVVDAVNDFATRIGAPTWVSSYLGFDVVFTMDPKNVQALLATQFDDFFLGGNRNDGMGPFIGEGIFTHDGKIWEHSRALLRPQFVRDQVADLDQIEVHVQNMLQHLQIDHSEWTTQVDLVPLFYRLTLDASTEFLFGQSVDSQLIGMQDEKTAALTGRSWSNFAKHFDAGVEQVALRIFLCDLSFLYSPPSFWRNCREVRKFADHAIDVALQEKASGADVKHERYVFLHALLDSTRDRDELRGQLLNMLLAGRDTTAGLIGWIVRNLMLHPAAFTRLRKTIIDEFGTYSNPQNLTFSALKSCTHLQRVLNESLRLNPPTPFNMRYAKRDTTLPRGGGPDGNSPIYIKKGQEVDYFVHVIHRRKDIWGPDADEFKPDRWIGRKSGWEFLPFNGGPRICLGQQYAMTEAAYVIVRLLQRFDAVRNLDPDPVLRHRYAITTSPSRLLVALHAASE